jgi:hypothetical protein
MKPHPNNPQYQCWGDTETEFGEPLYVIDNDNDDVAHEVVSNNDIKMFEISSSGQLYDPKISLDFETKRLTRLLKSPMARSCRWVPFHSLYTLTIWMRHRIFDRLDVMVKTVQLAPMFVDISELDPEK